MFTNLPLPKPNLEIESTKTKDNFFAQCYRDIIEHPYRQIRFRFCFQNIISCVSPIKKFELHANQNNLTEIVNLNHREVPHFYRNR